jgi:hypothetical protein
MPLGLGPFLDQIVTLLLLIAAVLGGLHLYKKYVDPPAPAAAQSYSAPVAGSAATHVLVTRTSRIKQWNFGSGGEVNGFLLADGTLATVPADFGARLRSAVDIGSEVTVAGYRSVSANHLEIISVQSVTSRGQSFRLDH